MNPNQVYWPYVVTFKEFNSGPLSLFTNTDIQLYSWNEHSVQIIHQNYVSVRFKVKIIKWRWVIEDETLRISQK